MSQPIISITRRILRHGALVTALALITVLMTVPAAHAGLIYDFTFFDNGSNVIGTGSLEVEQSVRDAGIDLNGVMLTAPFPPAGSHFVRITDLTALSFDIYGTTLTQSDLVPSPAGPDGLVFAADGSFLQFIDPNLGVVQTGATDVVFGAAGNRVIFDEFHPSGFEVELAGAQDCRRPSAAFPGNYTCQFSVTQRAEVSEPASFTLALLAMATGFGSRRRRRRGRS